MGSYQSLFFDIERQWWLLAGSVAVVFVWRFVEMRLAKRRAMRMGDVRCGECGHVGAAGLRPDLLRMDVVCGECKGGEIASLAG